MAGNHIEWMRKITNISIPRK